MQRALYFYVNVIRVYPLKLLKTINNIYHVIVHYPKNELKKKIFLFKSMSLLHFKVLKNASEFVLICYIKMYNEKIKETVYPIL